MTFYPDMSVTTMVTSGDHVRAVGWLHLGHHYSIGISPWAFRRRLRQFVKRCDESTEALGWGIYAGKHTCEYCRLRRGYMNFGVPYKGLLFVAPEMILHYVRWHLYLPPAEFIGAVLSTPLPGTERYWRMVAPFRRLEHKRQGGGGTF